MVLASTIIAVALGLIPTQEGQATQTVYFSPATISREVGRYSQSVDVSGVRHIRGFDQYGRAYRATVEPNGKVECVLGGQVIEFTVAEAS